MSSQPVLDPIASNENTACGAPGLVLAGKYELVREVGRGGMGSVWQAERLGWQAPVAVKLMTLPDTPAARERFEREVRLAAALRSPHVVQVLDHGVDEATRSPFIVMELLEGESLAARLRRLHSLSPSEVLTIVTHLGRALTRASEAGIVHRDLKPDNIYLVSNGDEPIVKVLDFGVAKLFQPSLIDGKAVTAEGRTIGTPWYMSPEQFRGRAPLDHRSDLWSLSVIACECLTGKRPFFARDFPTLALLLCGDGERPVPSSLGFVPDGFDEWFARATARDIKNRFQSAQELVDSLRPICGTGPSERMPPLVRQKSALAPDASSMAPLTHTNDGRLPFLRRRPMLTAGLVGGAVIGIVANIIVFTHRRSAPVNAPLAAADQVTLSELTVTPPQPVVPPAAAGAPEPAGPLALQNAPAGPASSSLPPGPSEQAAPSPTTTVAVPPESTPRSTAERPRKKSQRLPHPEKVKAQPEPAAPEAQGTIDGDRIIRTKL